MKLPRRQFLHLAAGAVILPAVSHIAQAETYPSHPVRVVVGFPPGGGVDIHARLIGQLLSERYGQQFVVENRQGAGSNIGTEAVVCALPDGYTLLLAFSTNAINAALYHNLNFNFIKDTAPVASIDRGLLIILVSPSFPAKTLPDPVPCGGRTVQADGRREHATCTVSRRRARDHRSDRRQVQAHIAGAASIEHIRTGALRALAVGDATRSKTLPDVPTVGEFVPGYEASTWFGVVAPKNTPADIIDSLNKQINAGLADPKMKTRLADLGGTVLAGSPADFGKLIAEETEKWARVVKLSGAKAD